MKHHFHPLSTFPKYVEKVSTHNFRHSKVMIPKNMNKLINFSFSNLNFNFFIQKNFLINASHVLNWKHLMFGKIRMVYHIWQNLSIYISCWTPCVVVKLMSHLIHCALVYYLWLNFKEVVMGKEFALGGNYIENKHVSTYILLEEKSDH